MLGPYRPRMPVRARCSSVADRTVRSAGEKVGGETAYQSREQSGQRLPDLVERERRPIGRCRTYAHIGEVTSGLPVISGAHDGWINLVVHESQSMHRQQWRRAYRDGPIRCRKRGCELKRQNQVDAPEQRKAYQDGPPWSGAENRAQNRRTDQADSQSEQSACPYRRRVHQTSQPKRRHTHGAHEVRDGELLPRQFHDGFSLPADCTAPGCQMHPPQPTL
jgi:hypothetical protein